MSTEGTIDMSVRETLAKLAISNSNAVALEKVAMDAYKLGYLKAWEEFELRLKVLREMKQEKSGMQAVNS